MTKLIIVLLAFFVGLRIASNQWGLWTWLGLSLLAANLFIAKSESKG